MKKKFRRYQYLIVFLLSISTLDAFSQAPPKPAGTPKITVTGTITDSAGKKIEGARIIALNKRNVGTSSDANGRFILDVDPGTVLVVSYVGYADYKIKVSAEQRSINAVLQIAAAGDAVIVTAYGQKQRKEAIVGSVTSVNPELLRTPSSNLTNAIAGQIDGAISVQRGGQPRRRNAHYSIRGVTTFGYSACPLILVDNIELSANDLARLNVDDIP